MENCRPPNQMSRKKILTVQKLSERPRKVAGSPYVAASCGDSRPGRHNSLSVNDLRRETRKDSVNPSALWLSHPSATTTGDMPAEQPPTSWLDAAPVSLLDRHDEAPTCSAPPIPQGPCPGCPRLAQEFEPWRQAAYYKAMLDRAVAREAQLHQEIARLQAQLRLRAQQLFGRKADSTATAEGAARPDRTPRPRGQQRGRLM